MSIVLGGQAGHVGVEPGRAGVAGDELVPVERAGLVHQRGADVLVGLPQRDRRAGRVHDEGHPPGVHDVERRHRDLAARGLDLGGGLVGRVHGEVGVPHGRGARGRHLRPAARRWRRPGGRGAWPSSTPAPLPWAGRRRSSRTARRRTPWPRPGRWSAGPPSSACPGCMRCVLAWLIPPTGLLMVRPVKAMSRSSPRTCQASSVAWAAVATRVSSGPVAGSAPAPAPASARAPKYVTDPIRWSASWVTSNSVHTVGLW